MVSILSLKETCSDLDEARVKTMATEEDDDADPIDDELMLPDRLFFLLLDRLRDCVFLSLGL